MGTWEHRAILEGNKGTRTPLGDPPNCNRHIKIHLFAKLKKILWSRFRATLNLTISSIFLFIFIFTCSFKENKFPIFYKQWLDSPLKDTVKASTIDAKLLMN